MDKNNRRLSQREKLFCVYYAHSMDEAKSAANAGYKKDPYQKAVKLLSKSAVRDEIARLTNERENALKNLSFAGYHKLAFSPIADAVSLLFMENPTKAELMNMDLYCISEIKKLKDGAMEIKFFDRLKSLEKLSAMQTKEQSGANSLVDALYLGAENLSDCVGDSDEL